MEVFAVLASVQSMGLTGIQGYPVTVEAYCVDGMPMFEIVGLPETAVKESRERGRAAMSACHTPFPVARLTLNLAPADVRKEGPAYDLPIALAILASMGRLDAETMAGMAAAISRPPAWPARAIQRRAGAFCSPSAVCRAVLQQASAIKNQPI